MQFCKTDIYDSNLNLYIRLHYDTTDAILVEF